MRKREGLELGETLEDRVSRLPDDILVNIISRLAIKEAGRTSVLSSRWKDLWTSTTALNFDLSSSFLDVWENRATLETKRSAYINWVNRVLDSHRGLSITEFKISCDLHDSHGSIITDWIYTALSKRVQKFELELSLFRPVYTFPQECYNSLKNPCGLSTIKSLRSLCLSGVDVTGEILEFFIHNCPLDRLRVANSSKLLILKVVGASIQLKHLAIRMCHDMKEVEISAPSLVSFEYIGPNIRLLVKNVLQLVDVSIYWCVEDQQRPRHDVGLILSYCPQLKNLDLGFNLCELYMQFARQKLPNLWHLILNVSPWTDESLLQLTCILKSCPFLQKLTLELGYILSEEGTEIHQIPKYPLQHLKLVELRVACRHTCELKFATYLFENAPLLEKVIVKSFLLTEERAKMLVPRLPPGVELVVLTYNTMSNF